MSKRPGPDLKDGVFSCIEKSHVIFFSESQGRIDILRVIHRLMDFWAAIGVKGVIMNPTQSRATYNLGATNK